MNYLVVKPGDPDNPPKGEAVWKGGMTPKGRTATMSCPECGKPASLSEHSITESGFVFPSVVCPRQGCTFHRFVRLEGWG